jgi:hypothetical protein
MDHLIAITPARQELRLARLHGGYCPLESVWTKPSRKKQPVEVKRALFPRWFFLPSELYRQGLIGIQNVVSVHGGEPLTLSGQDIRQIKQIERNIGKTNTRLNIHDEVNIHGIFKGYIGVITAMNLNCATVITSDYITLQVPYCYLSKR